MRLFAAVLPPEGPRAELAAAVDLLRECVAEGAMRAVQVPREGGGHERALGEGGGREPADGLRWTERAGWHFTLAFYGEVAEEAVPELSVRLQRGAARSAPFQLAVRGAGQFGKGAVLWAGAEGEIPALRRLADRAEAAARRAGVSLREHRRYHPHLTLAHNRGQADLRPYLAGLDAFTGTAWTVGELALVRSHLPRSGVPGEQPRYEKVGGWPLGGAG